MKQQVLDHQIIRHAYENVLTASARLIAFATGYPTNSDEFLINERQRVLATDDLLFFSINARRLMESVYPAIKFKNKYEVIKNGEKAEKTIREITNLIIHHKFIRKDDLKHFSPLVMAKSDRNERITFHLRDLIIKFEIDVIEPIVEFCTNDRLFLDRETYE